MLRTISLFALVFSIVGATHLRAQEPGENGRVIELQLAPAAAPTPALKYQLLPTLPEMQPEHAEFIYARMFADPVAASPTEEKDWERLKELLNAPLAEFSIDDAKGILERMPVRENFLRNAVRARDCDWHLPVGERPMFAILLPELQPLRNQGRLLALRAKLQIAEKDFDGAIDSIRTGLALSRQSMAGPTIIHGLVGVAIASPMLDRVAELATQANAPNLYWALTALPQPYADTQRWSANEMFMYEMSYPEWNDPRSGSRSEKYWDEFLARMHRDLPLMMGETLPTGLDLETIRERSYPAAKEHLLATGMSAAEVEKIGNSQAVTILTIDNYRKQRDEVFKWSFLPASEAMPHVEAAIQQLGKPTSDQGLPLAQISMPALNHMFNAVLRLERQLAMLRVIEAIRQHAAANGGKLPASLAEITIVPVPEDPWNNRPFDFTLEGEAATLQSKAPAGQPPQLGLTYKLSIQK